MRNKFIASLLFLSLLFSCKGQKANEVSYHIKQLEKAENKKNIKAIEALFDEEAILFTTELMPIEGRSAIVSIYDFVFANNDVESILYAIDSTQSTGALYSEFGKVTTRRVGQDNVTQPFKAVYNKQSDGFKILEISFGEEAQLKKELPEMLNPSGDFQIGQTTFFYDKEESGNGRLLSFQVWYPTQSKSKLKLPFRTDDVIQSLAGFLGMPAFSMSYFSKIESHSTLDAPAIPNSTFPVLIYNHGYGGFTQVYQTIFEELVSHGYIIVSIGHENESALLLKENGDVLSNTPDNPFYAKRAPELNGTEIGRWQSIILSSNIAEENKDAYKNMLGLTPLHNESTRLWALDTKAVLEKLGEINDEHNNLSGIFDLNRLGVFGHSLGGATAGQLSFGTTPFSAGINLDGFQFGDLYNNQLEIPFMFVSSNPEGDGYLRALSFLESAKHDCYQVAIKGFSHDNFTDLKYITEGDSDAMLLQRKLIIRFFDKYLKRESMNLQALENEYQSISMRSSLKQQ